MNSKEIHFSDDARNKLASGVQKLTDVVKTTMGPKGRNVLIQKPYGVPVLTKDGVSVAQEVFLEDEVENMGAQLVKEVSSNTADEAGDGTTTATVLANAIFQEGLRNVTAGSNPVEMKRGMDKAKDFLVEELKKNSKEISEKKEIAQVATISANGDTTIGDMIADAMEAVGKDGIITVEEAKGMTDELEIVDGLEFGKGYLSPYFINNTDKMTCEFQNPYILITGQRIVSMKDILHIFEHTQKVKRPLLIITDDVEGDALSTIVVNKMRGILDICVVKAPSISDNRIKMLDDIAILTDGTAITDEAGRLLKNVTVEDLGEAERVVISKKSTTIISGKGSEEAIKDRIKQIKAELDKSVSEYEKETSRSRISKLSGGVAVIKVGASTETEMKEKKDRIDDALGATKAAVDEGIIIGGGTALLKASKTFVNELEGDQAIGADIVLRGIKAPARQIIENAGEEPGYILGKILDAESEIGYNSATNEYVNMFDAGIIDSYKVARIALTNAVSVASMLLTTEATINIIKKD